jgi:Ser/Thr protein kinase RdoA (MazF antagonist)
VDGAIDGLSHHLADRYGIDPGRLTELDVGVFRVDRRDGPSWVARVFADRAAADLDADAALLRALEAGGFPAERCAHDEPVSAWAGKSVLVTRLVEGQRSDGRGRTFGFLGALLGRLHAHEAVHVPPGGAWHHLSQHGGPREEIAAAIELFESAEHLVPPEQHLLYDEIRDALEELDDCNDLPLAFVHPDFVPPNAITTPDDRRVIVDWTGAGRGPRLWSLAFLLWAGGARSPRLIDIAVPRYARSVRLTANELERLVDVIPGRPLTMDVWSFGHGRLQLRDVASRLRANRRLATEVSDRTRTVLAGFPVE